MASAAGSGTPPYKLLGKGTYGVVFEPALPNVNAAGNPVEFPGYVTKAFFEKKEYNKALTNAPALARDVPALHIPYNAYTRKVQLENIPRRIRKAATLRGRRGDPMYLIRMPHKGYSIMDIGKSPTMLAKIVALPVEVKVREIYKLMNIVKALGDAGYVHGDIREPNILINPDAGTMTIIDFDLLKPTSEFAATFPVPYYHIPPEAAVLLLYRAPAGRPFSPSAPSYWDQFLAKFVYRNESIRNYMYGEIFNNTDYYYNGVVEFHTPQFHRESVAYITSFCDAVRSATDPADVKKLEEHAQMLMSKTVDSFSLAYCLRYLFNRLTLSGADGELKKFLLDDLFPKMMSGNGATRLRIEDAMREFKEFAERSFGIDLAQPTAAAAVGAVEAEAARLGGLAAVAVPVAPVALSDADITREIKKRLTAIEGLRGADKKNAATTEMMNFIRLNAIPFLDKNPSFRALIITRCHDFLTDPVASGELKEACAALLALIDPRPASAKSKSKTPPAAASSVKSAKTLGSLGLSAASTKSKKGSAAAAAIGDLAAAAAAAPAPVAPAGKTRARKRREQRRRAKTREQARAAGKA